MWRKISLDGWKDRQTDGRTDSEFLCWLIYTQKKCITSNVNILNLCDIWSQASYRYAILWESFLDLSDSYFLFADLVVFYTHWTYMRVYHKWALAHSISSQFILFIRVLEMGREASLCKRFSHIYFSEYQWILFLLTMHLYYVYPAMLRYLPYLYRFNSKQPKLA
jgi:hypothetical protein